MTNEKAIELISKLQKNEKIKFAEIEELVELDFINSRERIEMEDGYANIPLGFSLTDKSKALFE